MDSNLPSTYPSTPAIQHLLLHQPSQQKLAIGTGHWQSFKLDQWSTVKSGPWKFVVRLFLIELWAYVSSTARKYDE